MIYKMRNLLELNFMAKKWKGHYLLKNKFEFLQFVYLFMMNCKRIGKGNVYCKINF